VITSPEEGEVVDPDNTITTWEPVTLTTAFNPPQIPVTIVGYQVIVTREDPLRVYSVDVSAETTSVSVPPKFLDAGTEYELEILAIEESDNQTISLIFFETE
jgi:nitrate reductase cytochrome c-type subunit